MNAKSQEGRFKNVGEVLVRKRRQGWKINYERNKKKVFVASEAMKYKLMVIFADVKGEKNLIMLERRKGVEETEPRRREKKNNEDTCKIKQRSNKQQNLRLENPKMMNIM